MQVESLQHSLRILRFRVLAAQGRGALLGQELLSESQQLEVNTRWQNFENIKVIRETTHEGGRCEEDMICSVCYLSSALLVFGTCCCPNAKCEKIICVGCYKRWLQEKGRSASCPYCKSVSLIDGSHVDP